MKNLPVVLNHNGALFLGLSLFCGEEVLFPFCPFGNCMLGERVCVGISKSLHIRFAPKFCALAHLFNILCAVFFFFTFVFLTLDDTMMINSGIAIEGCFRINNRC